MGKTQIGGGQIKDGDITSDDIGDAAVRGTTANTAGTQQEIAQGTISTPDLRNDAVDATKLLETDSYVVGALTINSTTKAFLPPRMTTTQRDDIATPSAGMLIYNNSDSALNIYTNAWLSFSTGGANTTLSNLADTVAINKNLNNFSAGTITASLTGAASLNLLLTGGTLTGDLTLANNKTLILQEATGNGTDSVTIKTPAALAASYTLTLPVDDGTSTQVLTTDGSGVLSWTTPAGTVNTGTQYQLAFYATSTNAVSGNSSITTNASNQLLVPVGTATAPSITFAGDLSTGIYHIGANNLGISTNGVLRIPDSVTTSTPSIAYVTDATNGIYFDSLGTVFVIGGAFQLRTTAARITTNVPLRLENGTAAAPAVTFVGSAWDSDSGLYWVGENDLGISTNGTLRLDVSTTAITSTLPIVLPIGAIGTPSLTFAGDTDTGIYSGGSNILGLVVNGKHVFASNTTEVYLYSNGVAKFYLDATSITAVLPFYAADGTAAAPSLTFASDTNTGIYRLAADELGIVCNGTLAGDFFASGVNLYASGVAKFSCDANGCNVAMTDGTAAAPLIRFSADTDTGIYRVGTDDLGLSTNGTLRLDVSTTAITSTLPIVLPNGTATAPSLTFASDTNTGIYRGGADQINFSAGGGNYAWINTTAFTFNTDILPNDDNAQNCGSAGKRWKLVRGVTITPGDLKFENDWVMTEGEKIGCPEEGIVVVSPTGKKYKINLTEIVE